MPGRFRTPLRAVALLATATIGLLVAHELDYRFVVPDPAHRHDLLIRTGHGWVRSIPVIALVAGIVAVLTAVTLGAVSRRGAEAGRRVWLSLAVTQSGAFLLLEAVERLLVGAAPDDRLPLITAVGITVQVIAAAIGAALLRLLRRAGAFLAYAVPRIRLARRIAQPRRPWPVHRGRPAWLGGRPVGTRAPPVPSH